MAVTYHWLSSLKTIVSTIVLEWCRLRLCMVEDVRHVCVGMLLVKVLCLDLRLFSRVPRRSR